MSITVWQLTSKVKLSSSTRMSTWSWEMRSASSKLFVDLRIEPIEGFLHVHHPRVTKMTTAG